MGSALARIDKAQLLEALKRELRSELEAATASQRETQRAATHEEARPENDKDTRALETSYLARGQAGRVAELRGALASLEVLVLRNFRDNAPLALSALVELDDGERRARYFLAPAGGGQRLEVDGEALLVVTPQAPLGRALLGRRTGDSVEVRTPQGLRDYEIVDSA